MSTRLYKLKSNCLNNCYHMTQNIQKSNRHYMFLYIHLYK